MISPDGAQFKPIWIRSDGVRLSAHWYQPSRERSHPPMALIMVHGFAGDQCESGLFPFVARAAAEAGIDVFTFDARGAGSSEGCYASTPLTAHVDDFRRVMSYATRSLKIPRQRVFALGFSLGAAVVGIAIRRGMKLGAAVYLSPATRPAVSMWPRYNCRSVRDRVRRDGVFIKPESKTPVGQPILDDLRTTDLGNRCFDLSVPLLICHGSRDARIPIEHTTASLDVARGAQTDFVRFEGASHSFKPMELHWRTLASTITRWLQLSVHADDSRFNLGNPLPERELVGEPVGA